VSVYKTDSFIGQHIGQVPTVRIFVCAVVVKAPLVKIAPSALETDELIEPACVGVEPGVECARMPFAYQARRVSGGLELVGDGRFAQSDPVISATFESVDDAGTMRISRS